MTCGSLRTHILKEQTEIISRTSGSCIKNIQNPSKIILRKTCTFIPIWDIPLNQTALRFISILISDFPYAHQTFFK